MSISVEIAFSRWEALNIALNNMSGPDVNEKLDEFINAAVDWFVEESKNKQQHDSALSNEPVRTSTPRSSTTPLTQQRQMQTDMQLQSIMAEEGSDEKWNNIKLTK